MLQLKADETILFQAGESGLIDSNPPFLQGLTGQYEYAKGTLYLTNQRLVFIGNDIKRETIRVGIAVRGVRFREIGTHNFDAPVGEIKSMKTCSIGHAWPIGVVLQMSDDSEVYFSLAGRKKLISVFQSLN